MWGKTEGPLPSRAPLVSLGVLAIAATAGGLTVAVSLAGRTAPASVSLSWAVTFLAASLLLGGWGLAYAFALRRWARVPWGRALYTAAACHLPLLLGLAVVEAVYSGDVANHVYSTSIFGAVAYRPLTLLGLMAGPILLQGIAAAAHSPRWSGRFIPVLAPVLVALGLRLWGIHWQLPYMMHNDESNYLGTAMIAWAHGDLNPHRFLNPTFMMYLDLVLYMALGGDRAQLFRVFAEALGHPISDPRGFFLVVLAARALVALFGAGTVLLVYLAARQLLNRRTALLAAWFMAVAFLHVRNSHYATNDVVATALATASFLFAARLFRSGRLADYLLAGLLGGLATSAKYNAGFFVLAILAAHFARQKRPGGDLRAPGFREAGSRHTEAASADGADIADTDTLAPNRGRVATTTSSGFPVGDLSATSSTSVAVPSALAPASMAPLLASGAASALGFLLGTPYSLLAPDDFLYGFRQQAAYGGSLWFGQQIMPTWQMYGAALAHGFGLVPTLLAALGILVLVRQAPRVLAVIAAYPVGYFAFMVAQQLFFARFAIPFLPFAAILAGLGASRVADELRRVPAGRLLAPVLLALALAQPMAYSVQGNLLMSREDTRVLADRWVGMNVPRDSLLLVDDISDLRPSHGWPSRIGLRSRLYSPFVEPTPWEDEPLRPVFVAITSFGYDGYHRGAEPVGELAGPYTAITAGGGRLVALFSPLRDGDRVGYSQDDSYTPFWYLMERERSGPTVRIYRFD